MVASLKMWKLKLLIDLGFPMAISSDLLEISKPHEYF